MIQWAKEQRRIAAASEARARAMADPVFADGFRAALEAGEKIGGTWPENPHAAGSPEASRWALGAKQALTRGGMDEGVMREVADEERGEGHLELVHRIERLSDELRMLRARERMGAASEAVERNAAALRLIEARWASMLRAPGTWGSLESLELQALLLLELRAALEGGAWEDVRRRHAALVRAGYPEAPARLASHVGASEERLLALLLDLKKAGRVAARGEEFAVGWWYAIGRCYEGVREVLGGRANINAPPVQRVVGPMLCQTEDERDALSSQLMDMPLETRVTFRGPFGSEELARAAMLAERGARWLIRIKGTSMLAPFLSDLGAADPDAPGHVFGDETKAHDFGSREAAQAWLDAHPEHMGWVVEYRGIRLGNTQCCPLEEATDDCEFTL